jgi:transcriptional regulator with XRE-family HTH domain
MSVGNRIKKLRKAKKLSQDKLAKLIGVSRGAVANYEVDMTEPKYENYKRLSDVLGVSISYLKTGEEKNNDKIKFSVPYMGTSSGKKVITKSNFIVDPSIYSENMYAIKATSTEMHPEIKEGDICTCVHNTDQLITDNMLVHYSFKDKHGIRMIKVDEETNQILLVPLNLNKHKIIIISEKDSKLLEISKIITIIRNF